MTGRRGTVTAASQLRRNTVNASSGAAHASLDVPVSPCHGDASGSNAAVHAHAGRSRRFTQ